MALIANLEFRVTENNGGGIALAIKEDDHFVYIHSGYESIEGQLIEDIKALFDGQHPSEWDGNMLQECKDAIELDDDDDDIEDKLDAEYWDEHIDFSVLMTEDFVEFSMFTGFAGQKIMKNALGIDDIEDFLETHKNSMTMTDFLALCK